MYLLSASIYVKEGFSNSICDTTKVVVLGRTGCFLRVEVLTNVNFCTFLDDLLGRPIEGVFAKVRRANATIMYLFLVLKATRCPIGGDCREFSVGEYPPSMVDSIVYVRFFMVRIF